MSGSMILTYGPQVCLKTGTVGATKLVRRHVIVKGNGGLFYARQGRHTFATSEEARKLVAAIQTNNPPDLVPPGLHVEAWWCWPVHHDPIGPIPEEVEL